jgi:hypothetical protein
MDCLRLLLIQRTTLGVRQTPVGQPIGCPAPICKQPNEELAPPRSPSLPNKFPWLKRNHPNKKSIISRLCWPSLVIRCVGLKHCFYLTKDWALWGCVLHNWSLKNHKCSDMLLSFFIIYTRLIVFVLSFIFLIGCGLHISYFCLRNLLLWLLCKKDSFKQLINHKVTCLNSRFSLLVSYRISRADVTLAWAASECNNQLVEESQCIMGCCWFWLW